MLNYIPHVLQSAAFWFEGTVALLVACTTLYRLLGGANEKKPIMRAAWTAWHIIVTTAAIIVLLLAHTAL